MALKYIRSRDNPLFKTLVKLSNSARERRASRQALLDGPHLIEAYAASGGVASALIASESGLRKPEIARLFEGTPAESKVVFADRLFEHIAFVVTPAGILALIPTQEPEGAPPANEHCVLLENLQDAGNVGSILRTAAAAGVRNVCLSKGCAFVWSAKVLRAGMGAHFRLRLYDEADLNEVARRFQGMVVVTDVKAERSLYDLDLRQPTAWIFGNEGAGVSPELATHATARVRIPMPGGTESLNVAAAAAICLYEQVRQRQ